MGHAISWMAIGADLQKAVGLEGLSVRSIELRVAVDEPVTVTAEVFIQEGDVAGIVEVVRRVAWVEDGDGVHDVTSLGDKSKVSRFVGKGVEGGAMDTVSLESVDDPCGRDDTGMT